MASDDYDVWVERVIGNGRRADPDHDKAGSYPYFEKKAKRLGLTVRSKVYPDMGTTDADGPHLWGVVFPEQDRLTKFDPKTNGVIETRPYAPERRFGGKAATRSLAMEQADECVRRGGWDRIEREPNGTLSALTPDPKTIDEMDEAEWPIDVWDDIP